MKSRAHSNFWKLYFELPIKIRKLAQKQYEIFSTNPNAAGLNFEFLKGTNNFYSVRVGIHYRAIGKYYSDEDTIVWRWIGTKEEFLNLKKKLK